LIFGGPEGVNVKKRDTNLRRARRGGGQTRGFSMIELLIVTFILMIVSAMAIVELAPTYQQQEANAAMIQVASQLRQAREIAMTQRRDIQVSFIGNNLIQLTQLNLPAGQTVLSTVPIQAPVVFMLNPGTPDTPDAFGNAGPIEFGGIVGGPPTMMFQSDGTFVSTTGVILNGTVFLGEPKVPAATRAVTILGATGRIRMYKANPTGWIN
jgi:type II secretory pathway pseudopilin PulG